MKWAPKDGEPLAAARQSLNLEHQRPEARWVLIIPSLISVLKLSLLYNLTVAASSFVFRQLLKAALSNSIQGRRRGGNNSLMEITNRTLENQTAVLDARFIVFLYILVLDI